MKPLLNLFAVLCLFLTSCSKDQPASPLALSGIAMTMPWKILIGDQVSEKKLARIQKRIGKVFYQVDWIMNKWNPDAELAKLNQLQAFEEVQLSKELYDLFEKSDYAYQMTQGLFDPTVETVTAKIQPMLEEGRMPSQQALSSLKNKMGWRTLHWEDGIFWKEHTETLINFSGIAKGLCVDMLVEALHESGVKNLFVEWGGEISSKGHHPDGRQWRVAIRAPASGSAILAETDIKEAGLATSGDEMQYYVVRDSETGDISFLSHLFNPLENSPKTIDAEHVHTASVLASKCYLADAYATALSLITDPSEASEWAQALMDRDPSIKDFWIGAKQLSYSSDL